jgi:hypothetical protein
MHVSADLATFRNFALALLIGALVGIGSKMRPADSAVLIAAAGVAVPPGTGAFA